MSNTKIPTLVGVDIRCDSPDLRGGPATATGWLRRPIVTKEPLDREIQERGAGIFGVPSRGPGTFYSLVDEKDAMVQARPG